MAALYSHGLQFLLTVKKLTGGDGVNVVYDPVGGDLAITATRAIAWGGRYLVVGFASGTIPSFPANHALIKAYHIIGIRAGEAASDSPVFRVGGDSEPRSAIRGEPSLAGPVCSPRRLSRTGKTGRDCVAMTNTLQMAAFCRRINPPGNLFRHMVSTVNEATPIPSRPAVGPARRSR